jgi:putative transposase
LTGSKKKSACSTDELRLLVDPGDSEISVRRQCALMGGNRSGLYYQPRGESEESLMLMRLIDEEYTRHPFLGSRRIREWLCGRGYRVGRSRVHRLMQRIGIEAVYPKPKLSQPGEAHKVYPYLLNGVEVTRVNQVWSTDITYVRMAGGFVYLVAVMDWYSRFVLSWALSVTMERDFCLEALRQALRRGRPEIFNTDHGSQFTSPKFTGELETRGIAISMDGRGRCFDNIFIERLWRSLKYEEIVCCERLACRGQTVLYRRWRMALRSQPAGVGFKPPQAAGVKSPGGERCGKGGSNSVR